MVWTPDNLAGMPIFYRTNRDAHPSGYCVLLIFIVVIEYADASDVCSLAKL